MKRLFSYFQCLSAGLAFTAMACAQSADWQSVVWREPQVRYLLADMTLNGGKTDLYRKYAKEERDPDSIEAIRLWDAGARVVNTNEFERKWIANKYGKDGKVMRVVFRGTERTITGSEVLLSSDMSQKQSVVRMIVAELSVGRKRSHYEKLSQEPEVQEALRCWEAGMRLLNTNLFALIGPDHAPELVYRHSKASVKEPFSFKFNTDVAYPETNVRYFMADIALGGSIEFYRAAAERDHEMGCLEAVRRTEEGYMITNLHEFERKKVDGKTLITRKGSNERISGMLVKLSSDQP
jgi:hypothetical protein